MRKLQIMNDKRFQWKKVTEWMIGGVAVNMAEEHHNSLMMKVRFSFLKKHNRQNTEKKNITP